MALLPILRYPDPRLHTVAKPVLAVDARVRALIADMLETMYDAQGIAWLRRRSTPMSGWLSSMYRRSAISRWC
jgi:hypothetical protein